VGEARANCLDRTGVLAVGWRQRHAAGHQHRRQIGRAGQGHQHRRQALVACCHAKHAMARRQRADQAPEDLCGVVAVGEAVEHALGTLAAAVAWVGDVAGEGHRILGAQFLGGGLHQQADLPMAGVITQRDRCAIGGADTALSTQDQHLGAVQLSRIPTHAHILAPGKQVAAGSIEQQIFGQG
jgi:hypothetical protein